MITAHVESLTNTLEEMKPLFPAHWEELALNQDHVPLAPQYDVYLERDRRGEVLLVTLRDLGRLVGYFVGFIAPGLHYRTCLTLTMDIFFVQPESRGRAGVKLFRAVEREARRRGVQRMFAGSKWHQDASVLFDHLGYEKAEVHYSKWLGD